MSIILPQPIATYFTADRADGEAVARCFSENGVVKDEGQTHSGRSAIAAWKTGAAARYSYTCEPIALDEIDGRTVITCHLAGDFPGSPVDLRFFFRSEEHTSELQSLMRISSAVFCL